MKFLTVKRMENSLNGKERGGRLSLYKRESNNVKKRLFSWYSIANSCQNDFE